MSNYTVAILWYASWPVTIYITYLLISKAISLLEKEEK